jgi:hypothetical protein
MRLPIKKLPIAYRLLVDLSASDTDSPSRQEEFMLLPLAERRRLMAEQAKQMVAHYEQTASEERWDELFAKPEAKRVMREMAREAREDHRAGRTTDIEITEDGRLAPAPTADSPCSPSSASAPAAPRR